MPPDTGGGRRPEGGRRPIRTVDGLIKSGAIVGVRIGQRCYFKSDMVRVLRKRDGGPKGDLWRRLTSRLGLVPMGRTEHETSRRLTAFSFRPTAKILIREGRSSHIVGEQ